MQELRKYRLIVEHKQVLSYWMEKGRTPIKPSLEANQELAEVYRQKPGCLAPWLELSRTPEGWRVCCMQYPNTCIGGKDATLEEAWNSPEMQRIRQQMLRNERPRECDPQHCSIAQQLNPA
jgi:hypothetical protein